MGWKPKLQENRRPGRKTRYTFRVGGKLHDLGTDRREAKRQADRLYAQHLAKQPMADEPLVVAELVSRYIVDRPQRAWHARQWAEFAGMQAIADLGLDHLADYARWMTRTKRFAPATVKDLVVLAHSLLVDAHSRGWCRAVPPRPKLPHAVRRPRDATPQDLCNLFASLPDRAGRLLRFILETGCRPGEACRLTWDQVDMDRGLAVLSSHKTAKATGRTRTLYLTAGALTLLRTVPRESRFVFVSRLGKPYTPDGLRAITRKRGPVNPYSLRHVFAQHLADSDYPDEVIAGFLGHSGTQTVRWYRQIRQQRLRRVAAALTSPFPQPPSAPDASASAPPPTETPRSGGDTPPPVSATDRTS